MKHILGFYMNIFSRKLLLSSAYTACAFFSSNDFTIAAPLPILNIVIDDIATGSTPFDSGSCLPNKAAADHISGTTYIPGKDACGTDTVVRTHDSITYLWNFTVNTGDAKNVTITQTLPTGLTWDAIPPECLAPASNGSAPPSSLSTDKRTLICNVGSVSAGSARAMFVQAHVNGSLPNAAVLTTSATISAEGVSTVTSNSVSDVVSAAPHYEFETGLGGGGAHLIAGPSGELGYAVLMNIGIYKSGTNRGSEALGNTINMVLSSRYGTNASRAKLYTWGPAGAAGACAINNAPVSQAGIRDGGNYAQLPYGSLSLGNSRSAPLSSVSDSGTFTCAQSAPGANVSVRITNADTTLNHVPNFNPYRRVPITDRSYAITGWVKLFVPVSDIPLRTTLDLGYTYSGFDPVSISGASNFGSSTDDVANNTGTARLANNGPTVTYSNNHSEPDRAYSRGQGLVLPGEIFTQAAYLGSSGTVDLQNPILCQTFENSKISFFSLIPQTIPPGAVVEYSAVGSSGEGSRWASVTDMANANCDDSGGPWYGSVANVPGGAAAITKIRMKWALQETLGNLAGLVTRVTVLTTIPGDIIPSFTSIKNDTTHSGKWVRASPPLDILDRSKVAAQLAGRSYLNLAQAKVANQHVPFDVRNPLRRIVAGQDLQFTLVPTFTSKMQNLPATSVQVTDTLPPELSYIQGSASKTPSQIIRNIDGSTKLVWRYTITPGTPIAPIILSAHVSELVANFTQVFSCAEITSPYDQTFNDPQAGCQSAERPLSTKADVLISNPSAFAVTQSTTTPEILVNGKVVFTLMYRNTAQFDLPNSDIIDVLPFNGDAGDPGLDGIQGTLDDFTRLPGSNFSGTVFLESIQTNHSEDVLYTKKASPLISQDPSDPSNQANGSTVWCTALSGGNCPSSAHEVTAIRFLGGTLPAGSSTRSITVTLQTQGNSQGDRYANNFGAKADGLLPVFTASLSAQVIGGTVSGTIFADENGNGIRDMNDAGIAQVDVELFADSNADGVLSGTDALTATVTSNAQGDFSVQNLSLDQGNGAATYFAVVKDSKHILTNYSHTVGITGQNDNSQDSTGYKIVLSVPHRDDDTADFGYRATTATCQPVSQTSTQLAADQFADAVNKHIKKIISIRQKQPASSSVCKPFKAKTVTQITANSQLSYIKLWSTIWTKYPGAFSRCGTGFLPSNCSSVDVSSNGVLVLGDTQKLSSAVSQATKGCSTVKKIASVKKKAAKALSDLHAELNGLQTTGVVCQ